MNKPYAPACDRNREPILAVIKPLFTPCRSILEIGSGTGQHAVYFAESMPGLRWQCSDLASNLPGIQQWLDEAALPNTPSPLGLDVEQDNWPSIDADGVFSANAVHIMPWQAVIAMVRGVGLLLDEGGLFVLYGPFNYNRRYTSESNARFDGWLQDQNPASGIRDFEDIDALASAAGMVLQDDVPMPSNNRIIYWKKTAQRRQQHG